MNPKTTCDPVVGEPAMTEQPPSASKEALNLSTRIRERYFAPGNEHVLELSDAAIEIDRFAERVCEQRVSAETERCWVIALEQRCERGTPWDLACKTIANAIRAPAERPAPPNWLQATFDRFERAKDSLRGIGVEQRTKDTGQPGCGTERRPSPEAIFHWFDAWLEDRLNDREKTIIREVFYCLDHPEDVTRMKDGRPIPSAIASTGEQPPEGGATGPHPTTDTCKREPYGNGFSCEACGRIFKSDRCAFDLPKATIRPTDPDVLQGSLNALGPSHDGAVERDLAASTGKQPDKEEDFGKGSALNPEHKDTQPGCGERVVAFDPSLFVNDRDTPLSHTMRAGTVVGERVDERGRRLVDIQFDHRPTVSCGHFADLIKRMKDSPYKDGCMCEICRPPKRARAAPQTDPVELRERPNTDPQPTTTSAPSSDPDWGHKHQYNPPSPPAVVDYTERARRVLERWCGSHLHHFIPVDLSKGEDPAAYLELHDLITDALSALASEHQAEIDDWKAEADNHFAAWKSATEALRQVYQAIGIERGNDNWPEFMERLKAHLADRDAVITEKLT
jgi:hypothetical protein